jgi:transposase
MQGEEEMEIVHRCCCGLDVHKKMLVACVIVLDAAGQRQKETRVFGSMTQDILALADWLTGAGCTHVAMESTGVYWKPIFNEARRDSSRSSWPMRNTSKRCLATRPTLKTRNGSRNATQHGLLRPSFIPPAPQRHLRELTRYRSTLVAERARLVNRVHKLLEDTNLKLTAVVTDVTGVPARAMLAALLTGETDPQTLASLARGKLRKKREQLAQALQGRLQPHHRFLLTTQLAHLDFLDEQVAHCESEIQRHITQSTPPAVSAELSATAPRDESPPELTLPQAPPPSSPVEEATRVPAASTPLSFAEALTLLDTIPGVNRRLAEIFLAEIGTDMSRFPDAAHLASWVGICPGNHQSAGKHLSGKTRKGGQALIEAAHGAMRTKDTYLSAQGKRLGARRGKRRAVVAIGHSILVIVYHVLKRKQPYQDLGSNYFDERDRTMVARQSVRRLEQLGYTVTLETPGEAA